MKVNKFTIASVLTLSLAIPIAGLAQEGVNSGGGGGDGFKCKSNDPSAIQGYTTRLVDTYGNTELDKLEQNNVGQLRRDYGIRTVARYLDKVMPEKVYPHPYKSDLKISFGSLLVLHYMKLYFMTYDLSPLPDLKDDNIPFWKVPSGCKKIQLAIQDIPSGVVSQSPEVRFDLPLFDRLFLRIHEVLISIRNQPGLDTTPIRKDVERLAAMLRDDQVQFIKNLTSDWENMVTGDLPNKSPIIIPQTLKCHLTWKMQPVDESQPKFSLPQTFTVKRIAGAGNFDDKNAYQFQFNQKAAVLSKSVEMHRYQTLFGAFTSPFIDLFIAKFVFLGTKYEINIHDMSPELGLYKGSVQASYVSNERSETSGYPEAYNTSGLLCEPQ